MAFLIEKRIIATRKLLLDSRMHHGDGIIDRNILHLSVTPVQYFHFIPPLNLKKHSKEDLHVHVH